MPTGAQALLRTLVGSGVTTCFTNPGTSEMHFVAALDDVPEMRAVLALFEGVATGAADGYSRMAGRPAATLLHLGSGLGNGLANLHNARKGKSPVVNIVGDHATYHTKYDAQLQSDIETVARNVSSWVRTSQSTDALPGDAVEAIAAAQGPPGQVATLILPADVSWSDGAEPAEPPPPPSPPVAPAEVVENVARALRSRGDAAILLGGRALREPGLVAASVTPEVCASSETIAPSGSSAPTARQTLSASSLPDGSPGRDGSWRAASPPAPAMISASDSRLASASWLGVASSCTSQRSGTRSLLRPG